MNEKKLDKITAGRYQILKEIERSGRSTLYKVYDARLKRTVALKMLNPGTTHDMETLLSLRHEAEILKRLRHPGIPKLYEYIEGEGIGVLVLEYVESCSLGQLLWAKSPLLSLKNAIRIIRLAGKILRYVHQQGLLHRDLKPGNILLAEDARVLLVDWDLAIAVGTRVTTPSGATWGTPAYMPPEQIQDRPLDARADLYSLGTVLYALLAGSPPFVGESVTEVLNKILHQAPPPLQPFGVPSALEQVVCRVLAKDPDERYPTAESFVNALIQVEEAFERDRTRGRL